MVGALLVTAAAVVTFAAYLNATAAPTTSYLVATKAIEPGTRFDDTEGVTAVIGSAVVDLPSPLDQRAIPVEDLGTLVGRVVVAPLGRGDLVTRTAVVDDGGVSPAQTVSFALPRTDAVGGSLRPGERIDILATYGSGDAAYTAYILRGVPLLRSTAPDGGPLGTASEVVLTVAVTGLTDVQALGHATATADVLVTRSTATAEDVEAAPRPFRADPDATGPRPDPAASTSPEAELEVETDVEAVADIDAGDAG